MVSICTTADKRMQLTNCQDFVVDEFVSQYALRLIRGCNEIDDNILDNLSKVSICTTADKRMQRNNMNFSVLPWTGFNMHYG